MNLYFGSSESKLIAYLYSGLAGEINGREPTLDYFITHSGRVVAWQSRL
jgi:hypothetical protein